MLIATHQQRGLVLTSLVMITPLIIFLFWLTLGHYQAIQFTRHHKKECRKQVESIHHQLKKNIDDLLRLNHSLRYFRAQKKLAEALIQAGEVTSGTALFIQAMKGLKITRALQEKGKLATQITWQKDVFSLFRRHEQNHIYHLKSNFFSSRPPIAHLPLQRKDPLDPFSDLVVDKVIESQMTLVLFWRQKALLNTILKKHEKEIPQRERLFVCASAIKWHSPEHISVRVNPPLPQPLKELSYF